MPRQEIILTAADILLFTQSGAGRGRDTNDTNNKTREEILKALSTSAVSTFLADTTHGAAWQALKAAWTKALTDLAAHCNHVGYNVISVVTRGGRKFNWDIDVCYAFADGRKTVVKVEFKFGGTSVNSIPEFFNPAADKPFHSVPYAAFFYDNYMNKLCDIYGIPLADKPPRDLYLKHCYKNTPSAAVPFFKRLRDAEDAEQPAKGPKYQQKAALAHKSIQEYLQQQSASTDLAAITAEFQRSQAGKHFLIYSGGQFHHDRIDDAELIAHSVVGVKGDNLVIQSAKPTTQHHMLLRWKNHHCILFPAWQISMVRNA